MGMYKSQDISLCGREKPDRILPGVTRLRNYKKE